MTDIRCPNGLLPGQLSLLEMRRVIMGDIAVTLVDLARRGFAEIEQVGGDWAIRLPRNPVPRLRQQALVGHERALLAGLPRPAPAPAPVLPDLVQRIAPHLEEARAEIIRAAVHRHWVHHLHHDRLTDTGEQLVADLGAFVRALRKVKAESGESALVGVLPYALHYHLVSRENEPLARFAAAWVKAFGDLPGWRPPPEVEPRSYDPNKEPWPHNPAPYSGGMPIPGM